MTFAPLRGMRDYPPPEAGARSALRARMRAAARRCGFVELEAPCIESLELYRVKSGEEIAQQVWAFRDKGGRDVALAPESTPSLVRVFIDRAKAEPLPVKWFTVGKLWRYEEPQAGRTREFLQVNLDILGVEGIAAEGEILASAAHLLDEVGAKGLYAFRVNDRALAQGLGAHWGVKDTARFLRALDRFLKSTPDAFARELDAAGVTPEGRAELRDLLTRVGVGVAGSAATAFLKDLEALDLPAPGPEGIARLRSLLDLIPRLGLADRVVLDPTVVRGLAYYTSTVFEAYDLSGDHRALFGGGRYDHLIELFGGPPTPACGLALGDQTLELLLKAHGRWPEGEPPLDTYVIAVTPADVGDAVELVQALRSAGVGADYDLMTRSLSRQLKEAARRRARRAILIGPAERAKGVVVERDLTTGTQTERTRAQVLGPA
ncbi:MAG: histidine--tRNA ligase [Thermoplasmata archaeon]